LADVVISIFSCRHIHGPVTAAEGSVPTHWRGAVAAYPNNPIVRLMRKEVQHILQTLTQLCEYMEMTTPMFEYGGLDIVLFFLV
jgi:hypothetical protein